MEAHDDQAMDRRGREGGGEMSPDPVKAFVARLESRGFDPFPTGPDSWESRCPAHNGSRRNLSIRRGDDGRALIHCHHADGCSHEAIVSGLDLTVADLFPPDPTRVEPPNKGKPKSRKAEPRVYPSPEAAIEATARKLGRPTARWAYHEADGAEWFIVFRFDPPEGGKQFRPVHATPGGWAMGDPPGPLPLFHLTELAGADRIFVTEGEKACELAEGLGVVATTTPTARSRPPGAIGAPWPGRKS